MTNPAVNNTPAGVLGWLEEFIRDLKSEASQEVLEQHLRGLTPDDQQLRLLFLAQMVALNTTVEIRKEWAVMLIVFLAKEDGVDLTDPGEAGLT